MTRLPPPEAVDTSTSGVDVAASHRIAAHLRTAILAGEIRPGERIRQEEVADRIQVSRLPVREALRILEAEGLVENIPNRGARVCALDPRELDLLYQMRERLEPLALVESVPRLEDNDVTRLHDLHEQIYATEDIGRFVALDRELHLLSYSRCDMAALSSAVLRMWNATEYYRRRFMQIKGSQQRWIVNAEHGLLVEAIARRDVVDAAHCLEGHIRRTRVQLARQPEGSVLPDGGGSQR